MGLEELPTQLWLSAEIRRCNQDGTPVVVLHRGDPDRGTVIVRVDTLGQGIRIFTRAYGPEGHIQWTPALDGAAVDGEAADAYVARCLNWDPDAWVVEAEERSGDNPFAAGFP